MTTKQYIKKLESRLRKLKDINIFYDIVATVHAKQVTRIFDRGLTSKNQRIGTYSTKPILVGRKSFHLERAWQRVFKQSKNKNSPYRWVTYNNKHLLVIPGGYKALRALQSMKHNMVVLHYSQILRIDYTNSLTITGDKIVSGLRQKINIKKFDGIVNKYGKEVFMLTPQERKTLVNLYIKKIRQII